MHHILKPGNWWTCVSQWEFNLVHSTSYYPQGNGLAESSNKILVRIIRKLLDNNKKSWDSKLKFSLWAHRVLQLQLFPKFFKILDPPFDFIFPRIVWIPELYFCSATNLDFLRLNWGQLFSFISKVEWSKTAFLSSQCFWLWTLFLNT